MTAYHKIRRDGGKFEARAGSRVLGTFDSEIEADSAIVQAKVRRDAGFSEEDHPRDKDGKFGAGAGEARAKAESAAHQAANSSSDRKARGAANRASDAAKEASVAAKKSGTTEDYAHAAHAHAAAAEAHEHAGTREYQEEQGEDEGKSDVSRHADLAGKKADRASDAAKTPEDHKLAAEAHKVAAEAHHNAASETDDEHEEAHHEALAKEHEAKAAGGGRAPLAEGDVRGLTREGKETVMSNHRVTGAQIKAAGSNLTQFKRTPEGDKQTRALLEAAHEGVKREAAKLPEGKAKDRIFSEHLENVHEAMSMGDLDHAHQLLSTAHRAVGRAMKAK